jgi:hypothetical protein
MRARRACPQARDSRDEQFVGSRSADEGGAESSSASMRSASQRLPIRRRRLSSRYCACAAFTRSPYSSSVARAASSVFAGQPRSRETSAISASATTHFTRATESARQQSLRGTSCVGCAHRDGLSRAMQCSCRAAFSSVLALLFGKRDLIGARCSVPEVAPEATAGDLIPCRSISCA